MSDETGKQINNAKRAPFTGDVLSEKAVKGADDNRKIMKCVLTEDFQAGENARNESKDIQYIVDHAFEAFWQVDNDFKITFTNAACGAIAGGFTSEDFIGRSLIEFLTPEGIEKLQRGNRSRLKDEVRGIKTSLAFFELQMKRKDGTYCWVGLSSSPIRDRSGKVIGYQGILRDISGFKKQEANRKRLEELLIKAEKMAPLANITSGVARELNNLIGGILVDSELLRSCDNLGNSTFHQHIGNIINSGERATALIQDLLGLFRRDGENRQNINLNELLPACLRKNEFKKLSGRYPGVTLNIDLEPSLHNVNGSLPQLNQSIMDLLSMSFRQAGHGGTVSVATRTVYLGRPVNDDDNLSEGEYVVLSINDTGGGLDDEDVRRAFEPFYARKFMKKSVTGLELSIVREIIRDHNGFLEVYSKIGSGTAFIIYLPVSHGDAKGDYGMMPQTNNSDMSPLIN